MRKIKVFACLLMIVFISVFCCSCGEPSEADELVRCLNERDKEGIMELFCESVGSSPHIDFEQQIGDVFDLFGDRTITSYNIARKYVFCSDQILKTEIAAGNILDFLLSKFIPAAIRREDKAAGTPMDERLFGIISDNYRKNYDHYSKDEDEETRLYLRLLLVTDYVCGMTDSFAKRLYQELGGIQ